MNLVLFVHKDARETGSVLTRQISKKADPSMIRTCNSLSALEAQLKQVSFYGNPDVYVLLADTPSRLASFEKLKTLLADKRLVLVLPDDTEETLSRVYRFYPRYFTVMSDTCADLRDVLAKMIH